MQWTYNQPIIAVLFIRLLSILAIVAAAASTAAAQPTQFARPLPWRIGAPEVVWDFTALLRAEGRRAASVAATLAVHPAGGVVAVIERGPLELAIVRIRRDGRVGWQTYISNPGGTTHAHVVFNRQRDRFDTIVAASRSIVRLDENGVLLWQVAARELGFAEIGAIRLARDQVDDRGIPYDRILLGGWGLPAAGSRSGTDESDFVADVPDMAETQDDGLAPRRHEAGSGDDPDPRLAHLTRTRIVAAELLLDGRPLWTASFPRIDRTPASAYEERWLVDDPSEPGGQRNHAIYWDPESLIQTVSLPLQGLASGGGVFLIGCGDLGASTMAAGPCLPAQGAHLALIDRTGHLVRHVPVGQPLQVDWPSRLDLPRFVVVDAPLHPVGGFGWRGAAIFDPSLVWLALGASALRAVLRRAGLWGDRNEHGTYGGVIFPQWLHIPAADAATWRGGDYTLVVHWPTNWPPNRRATCAPS